MSANILYVVARSPPPKRGIRDLKIRDGYPHPFTPAYARNTTGTKCLIYHPAAHPRLRGEYQSEIALSRL